MKLVLAEVLACCLLLVLACSFIASVNVLKWL